MKIVVIGGTGLIGSKTVERLRGAGHDVVAASPNSGINTFTGEGLDEALKGAKVVVDLANSPSFEEGAAMEFFDVAGRNLLEAETRAGVKHHVALSVVGTDRLQGMGYFRAKQHQEELIKNFGKPYTIVHSTQFYEFMGAIAQSGTDGNEVRLPSASLQPIAADNVADAMAMVAQDHPLNDTMEIAGPQRSAMTDFVAKYLKATNDPRKVVVDETAPYFEVQIDDRTLVPADGAHIGRIWFTEWLKSSAVRK